MHSARKSFSEPSVENNVAKVDPAKVDTTRVDPRLRRPANADESVPEALVPDVVRRAVPPAIESSQTRWARIARRAYELAQERGFTPGAELSDWLQAEKEIDAAEQQRQAAPENQLTG